MRDLSYGFVDGRAILEWDEAWQCPQQFNAWPETELVRWASTLKAGSSVLEVGCGQGANLSALLSFDLDPWGVDVAQEAVDRCVWLLGPSQVKVGSAVELEFDSESFDAVCDVQCFQHLPSDELARAYAEAMRVLKPDGRFFEMFLVGGQEHFDLPFCEFDAQALITAGLRPLELGCSYRQWKGRSYTYLVFECERV